MENTWIESKIKKIEDALNLSANAMQNARILLSEISWNKIWESVANEDLQKMAQNIWNSRRDWDEWRIVEWTFDWEKMINKDWETFPIHANYISKSKLVEWDWLKLTIKDDWRFLYKQIQPMERAHLIWNLSLEEWQYKVIAEWRIYKVILAAVTFLKLSVWDKLTIVVPKDLNSEWAAVDSIIPE